MQRVARLTPAGVLVLVLLAASAFVTARWLVAADRDVGRFVVAGTVWSDATTAVPRVEGAGYDGQFAYRLALDPARLGGRAGGVALDAPLRLQRATYPALAWAVSLGQDRWVPAALVVVNVVALGLLGLLGALLARDLGRPPAAGLLVPAFSGFATTLARDLTEVVTALLLVAGVLALQRGRPGWAALALSGAVLSRESALLLVLALGAGRWRTGRQALLVTAVPAAAFLAWQAACLAAVGQVPLLSSSGKNLGLPFVDLAQAAAGWVRGALVLDRAALITLGQAVVLAVVVACAARAVRTSRVPPGVTAAWAAALLLVVSLTEGVWRGPADFRTASELAVLSTLVLLGGDRPLRLPAVALAGAGIVTVLFRVTSL